MRKTKKKLISYFLVLLMICVAFTFEPISVKAATTYTVTTEAELRDAVATAQDGDTIRITKIITVSSSLTINKDVTLDFGDMNSSGGLQCINSNSEATLIISGCSVTIKGVGPIITYGGCARYAILVKDGGKDTTLNIDNVNCEGTLAVKDDNPDDDNSVTVNINYGRFSAYGTTEMFDVGGGKIVINAGCFSKNPNIDNSKVSLGENAKFFDWNSEYPDIEYFGLPYEVCFSQISSSFEKILTNEKLVITSVAPLDEWNARAYINSVLVPYYTDESWFEIQECVGDWNNNLFVISYTNSSGRQERHIVDVVYDSATDVDNDIVTKARDVETKLPVDLYGSPMLEIVDMEVINMWVSGFDPDASNTMYLMGMINYSGELKEKLGNTNFDLKVVGVGAGDETDLFTMSAGEAVICFNDVDYASIDFVQAQAEHIIYVPAGTYTSEQLKNAAQERINDYLGDSSKVELRYGGPFNTLTAPDNWVTHVPGDRDSNYR